MSRHKKIFFYLLAIIAILLPGNVIGQEQTDTTKSATIYVDNADKVVGEIINEKLIRHLKGNVQVIQDSTFFYCDSASIYGDSELFAFGNVVILQSDSTTIFSDSLYFNSDSSKAILSNRVLLMHQGKQLRTSLLEYQVDKKLAYYENTAQIFQDSTVLKSKKGLYDLKKDMIYFREHVSVVDSSFQLRADSLRYDTRFKRAIFTGPTVIIQDTAKIFCENGYYDIDKNNAAFYKNPVYIEPDKTAKAFKMQYLSEEELILLAGNARYNDQEQDVKADTIKYYRKKDKSILIGNVIVLTDDGSMITGEYVEYDNETGDFNSKGRTSLNDDATRLTADLIDISDENGYGMAYGNVVLEDTSAQMEILCDLLYTFDDNSRFKAYNDSLSRPLLKKVMDNDTLFLAADTLYSYEIIEGSDTFQMINAYYDVRIFQTDFQAVSDSLSYNSKDSTFILYRDPVMWSDTTQFSGDTISIFLSNDKIEQLFIRPNAMIVNAEAGELFNQIGGKRIRAYFRNDSLYQMHAIGNAESLYYLKDEQERFMGAIKTLCSSMIFEFQDNDLKEVKYYEDPVSNTSPMKKELINPQRLKGFKWSMDRKPADKYVNYIPVSSLDRTSIENRNETENAQNNAPTDEKENMSTDENEMD